MSNEQVNIPIPPAAQGYIQALKQQVSTLSELHANACAETAMFKALTVELQDKLKAVTEVTKDEKPPVSSPQSPPAQVQS